MSVLDNIKQMQEQGMSDPDIAQKLREQGLSPRDIDDSINQTKIKAAIYEESGQNAVMNNSTNNNQEMQQSMMTQEIASPQEAPMIPQQAYPQYAQQDYYSPPQQQVQIPTEIISEVAEQIVSEKLSEIKKSIGNIAEFKAIMDSRVSNLDERLKKIERMIDQLQLSILNKIGSYTQSIQDIKEEMTSMQDSFSKVINPLVDRARGKPRNFSPSETEQETPAAEQERQAEPNEQVQQQKKKRKPDFEDFLR